jgi:hypothetical protein
MVLNAQRVDMPLCVKNIKRRGLAMCCELGQLAVGF